MTAYEIGLKYNICLNPAIMFKIRSAILHNIPSLSSRPESKLLPRNINFYLIKKNLPKLCATFYFGSLTRLTVNNRRPFLTHSVRVLSRKQSRMCISVHGPFHFYQHASKNLLCFTQVMK